MDCISGLYHFYLITAYYAGLYDKRYKRSELVGSSVVSIIVLLAGYALLPEQYRFSRAIVLFGALLAFMLISILRWLLIRTNVISNNKDKEEVHHTVIAGTQEEYERAVQILNDASFNQRILGRVAVESNDFSAIGHYKTFPPFQQPCHSGK